MMAINPTLSEAVKLKLELMATTMALIRVMYDQIGTSHITQMSLQAVDKTIVAAENVHHRLDRAICGEGHEHDRLVRAFWTSTLTKDEAAQSSSILAKCAEKLTRLRKTMRELERAIRQAQVWRDDITRQVFS